MVLHTGCTEKKPIKINLFLIERNARSIDSFKKLFFFFLIKRDFFFTYPERYLQFLKLGKLIFFSGKILVERNFDSILIQVCVFLRGTGFGKVQVFCHVFPNFMRCLSMFTFLDAELIRVFRQFPLSIYGLIVKRVNNAAQVSRTPSQGKKGKKKGKR